MDEQEDMFSKLCKQYAKDSLPEHRSNTMYRLSLQTNTSSCPMHSEMMLSEERFDFVEHTRMFEFYGSYNVFNKTEDGYESLEMCYYWNFSESKRT